MNKNVLILGASGDIVNAIAIDLANQRYNIILHYHKSHHTIERLQYMLRADAIIHTAQADLAEIDADHNVCNEIAYAVHVIVFVSGSADYGLFQEVSDVSIDAMIRINVKALGVIREFSFPLLS